MQMIMWRVWPVLILDSSYHKEGELCREMTLFSPFIQQKLHHAASLSILSLFGSVQGQPHFGMGFIILSFIPISQKNYASWVLVL